MTPVRTRSYLRKRDAVIAGERPRAKPRLISPHTRKATNSYIFTFIVFFMQVVACFLPRGSYVRPGGGGVKLGCASQLCFRR